RRARRVEKGLCSECGKRPLLDGLLLCGTCSLKARARSLWGNPNRYSDLVNLFEQQGGICPYTGEALTYETAEVDHVQPKSCGGSDDLSNLEWVSKDVNRAKLNL